MICLAKTTTRSGEVQVKVNYDKPTRKTAARRADGPTEITAADEHRKTV